MAVNHPQSRHPHRFNQDLFGTVPTPSREKRQPWEAVWAGNTAPIDLPQAPLTLAARTRFAYRRNVTVKYEGRLAVHNKACFDFY